MTDSTTADVDRAARAAAGAFATTAVASDRERAGWLRSVADELDRNVGELVGIAGRETGLTEPRLRGEVARTSGQLRMFADVIEEGSYLEAVIDHADPGATPPKPDLRRILRPIGPVAIFAASNFPFAFSVAGGDTASALAVGAPVVVKAHSGHRQLSERTAELVTAALSAAGAPQGTFSLVSGREAGIALIEHPLIAAGSFTGSVAGGRALYDRAAQRPDPIPFFGELGSLNPVVVTVAADRARGASLAEGLATSFQGSSGQLCTKPGLVFVPEDSVLEAALAAHVGESAHRLLTDSIDAGFRDGIEQLAAIPGVELVAGARPAEGQELRPVVYAAGLEVFADARYREALTAEVFGPATLLVRYPDSVEDLPAHLAALEGSLTATIHAEPEDDIDELVTVLRERAGRLLFAGWPTGVAVTWSQHHGGPWPATTSQHTSVGATATRRFQRPIVYQDAPERVLPGALLDANPLGIPRRVDEALDFG